MSRGKMQNLCKIFALAGAVVMLYGVHAKPKRIKVCVLSAVYCRVCVVSKSLQPFPYMRTKDSIPAAGSLDPAPGKPVKLSG
jgi:hypothetical protein